METTWITVTDTAVKIGLGTLIGGVFAIVMVSLTSRRKLHEKFVEKCRNSLEEISEELERINSIVIQKSSIIAAVLEDSHASEIHKFAKADVATLDTDFGDALLSLHKVEAKLCLLGVEEISAMVEQFRIDITHGLELEDLPPDDDYGLYLNDKYNEIVSQHRLQILRAMAKKYRNI